MIDLTNKKNYYNIYPKKKKNGKIRWIYAPLEPLKSEQFILKNKLEDKYNPSDCVFGFIEGRSPIDAAKLHVNKDWVISFDIDNFFPSITKEMVLSLGVSEYESEIATLDGKLVQGSPCSPVISNLVFANMDRYLDFYAYLFNYSYSRYADDITFSSNGKNPYKGISRAVNLAVNKLGMKINKSKTKIMYKNREQRVLGITVNTKPSINSKIRKILRAKIHQGAINESDIGYISYINSISCEQAKKLIGGQLYLKENQNQ